MISLEDFDNIIKVRDDIRIEVTEGKTVELTLKR